MLRTVALLLAVLAALTGSCLSVAHVIRQAVDMATALVHELARC